MNDITNEMIAVLETNSENIKIFSLLKKLTVNPQDNQLNQADEFTANISKFIDACRVTDIPSMKIILENNKMLLGGKIDLRVSLKKIINDPSVVEKMVESFSSKPDKKDTVELILAFLKNKLEMDSSLIQELKEA